MNQTYGPTRRLTPTTSQRIRLALVATIAFTLGVVFVLAAQQSSLFARQTAPAATVAPLNQDSPTQHASSYDFNGQHSTAAHRAGAGPAPIRHASSSAYDGQPLKSAIASSKPRHGGTGSAYDGQRFTPAPDALSPAAAHAGSGSVYDGQPLQHRAVPARLAYHSGTSSVYNGQPLQQHPLAVTSRVSTVGTGSVYDGQPVR